MDFNKYWYIINTIELLIVAMLSHIQNFDIYGFS